MTSTDEQEVRLKDFLSDLNLIVKKFGLALVTCSCCGLSVQEQRYDRETEWYGLTLGWVDFNDFDEPGEYRIR